MDHYEQETEKSRKLDLKLLKRLFSYMKPFMFLIILSVTVILAITIIELIKPVVIGQAIDKFINGYKNPFIITHEITSNTIEFKSLFLKSVKIDKINSFFRDNNLKYASIVYYNNNYYLFTDLNYEEINYITNLKKIEISNNSILFNDKKLSGILLTSDDLKILRKGDYYGIVIFSIVFLVILIIGFILNYLQVILLQFTGQKIIYNIRSDIFTHIISLPLSFFDKNPVGRIVTRITNDTETLNEFYTNVIVNLSRNALLVIGIFIVLLITNSILALIALSVIPLIIIFTIFFRKLARSNYRIMRKVLASLNSFLSENISGMKIIQLFNVEKKKYDEFDKISTDLYKSYKKEIVLFGIFRPAMFMLYIIALCLTLVFGGMNVINNVISFGTLFIFIMYIGRFFDPIMELAEQFNILQSAMASSERIFEILDEELLIKDSPDSIEINNLKNSIEFKNVWFAYNNEDWVLKDVSFQINHGEIIALVGSTGSGKTTIINLLTRYYEIQKGEILIDGVNI
ncbi:MAG TPA: ABC transporter transmembrane domain-containing protein, partial [Spirochaetota bacterium]|nr:ABC transporter transmembrane domain-containing protein [Spirochaetota bacterium]